jgi:hypothetical protein
MQRGNALLFRRVTAAAGGDAGSARMRIVTGGAFLVPGARMHRLVATRTSHGSLLRRVDIALMTVHAPLVPVIGRNRGELSLMTRAAGSGMREVVRLVARSTLGVLTMRGSVVGCLRMALRASLCDRGALGSRVWIMAARAGLRGHARVRRRYFGVARVAGRVARSGDRMRIMTARARLVSFWIVGRCQYVLVGVARLTGLGVARGKLVGRVAIGAAFVTARKQRVWLVVTLLAALIGQCCPGMSQVAGQTVVRRLAADGGMRVGTCGMARNASHGLDRRSLMRMVAGAAVLLGVELDGMNLALLQLMAAKAICGLADATRTEAVASGAVCDAHQLFELGRVQCVLNARLRLVTLGASPRAGRTKSLLQVVACRACDALLLHVHDMAQRLSKLMPSRGNAADRQWRQRRAACRGQPLCE